ncbi:MAG: DUF4406 domain-containing protein [Hyphomicrobiaceae bacterium]|nr:MAG: DUF4406 domain-containing protein [Hyphomicrobiaceae bacterium]
MKVIYIAGPFRGPTAWAIEQNVRRAETLALKVWQLGAVALCPHTNTRLFDKEADDIVFLDGTMELLRRCDAVLLTDDWQKSSGARAEVEEARSLKRPVFANIHDLHSWLLGEALR